MIEPWAMPMIVPPKPWLTYNSGGYLTQRHLFVRLKDDPVHLSMIHQASANGRTDQILYGLDILGQTPWLINERILVVALDLWNSGINVATLEQPPEPKQYEFRKRETFENVDEYHGYVREARMHGLEVAKSHSTMCDTNYKLEIARQFARVPFYLPHSVDFRGRAYPIPPHLSHIGSDLSRGLLVFAEGRALGQRGLWWLKIQLANMFGFDKHPLADRVGFVDAHLDDIYDSADNPLKGKQWWKKADEPWQCLAACFELCAILRSDNPEQYISHFPVQQDGSCNGLQHYAALGGDTQGAIQVNLTPSPAPQDIYAEVARLVSTRIDCDASRGVPVARLLQGKITRKIVKQPVMTNVYGVTPYGARQQIKERLKEFNVVPPEMYGEAAKYVGVAVFDGLGKLFVNAKKIQDWLTGTAIEISRSVPEEVAAKYGYDSTCEPSSSVAEGREIYRKPRIAKDCFQSSSDPIARYPQTSLGWDTPLGFRVVQPYLRSTSVTLKTVLQTINLHSPTSFDPIDISKQASAFPPNFIHSLDATHMFKTALASHQAGITFASVHDCFWTHAATTDTMNRVLREQFVELHEQPILENLYKDLKERYRGHKVPVAMVKKVEGGDGLDKVKNSSKWREICILPPPPKGSLDIRLVLNSHYFFS